MLVSNAGRPLELAVTTTAAFKANEKEREGAAYDPVAHGQQPDCVGGRAASSLCGAASRGLSRSAGNQFVQEDGGEVEKEEAIGRELEHGTSYSCVFQLKPPQPLVNML